MSKEIPLYHVELVRDRTVPYKSVEMVDQCAEVLHELLDRSPVEQFVVLHLDPKANLMGVEKIGLGMTTGVSVSMAEIFRGALLAAAPLIVLGHNHPYDDPTPSEADWRVTLLAKRLGEELGIRVMDHIIVTPTGKHISMRDQELKDQDTLLGSVADAIDHLSPEDKLAMENRLRSYGVNPNALPRGNGQDLPIDFLPGVKPGTSLSDLMREKLQKIRKTDKNSN